MYGLSAESQRNANIAIASAAISTIAVGVRVFCKLRYKLGVRGDDYWIVVTASTLWITTALAIWGLVAGSKLTDPHQAMLLALNDESMMQQLEKLFQALFISYTFYLVMTFTLKLSILTFYTHLFSVKDLSRRLTRLALILHILWFLTAEIVQMTMCRPLTSIWRHDKQPGKCFNINTITLTLGIIECCLDTLILGIPVHMAFDLHIPMRRRLAVAGIFALGGFSIGTNAVRVWAVYVPAGNYTKHNSWIYTMVSSDFNKSFTWLHVHMITAIICACLPIYKKLFLAGVASTSDMFSLSRRSLLRMRTTSTHVKDENMSEDIEIQLPAQRESHHSVDGDSTDKDSGVGMPQTTVLDFITVHPC